MNVLSDSKTWDAETSTSVLRMQQKVVDELKPKHKAKIEQLRLQVADVLKPCHNDFLLLRWLNAAKFDVGQAEKIFRANLKWRMQMQMDYANHVFKPSEVVWKYYTMGPSGQDKNGNLVWIMQAGKMDIRGYVLSGKSSDITRYSLCVFEYMQRLSQIHSEKIGKLVSKQIVIVDFEGFRIQDYLWKPALLINIQITKQLVANYPDLFEKMLIINAPKVFSIFFALLKPFLSQEYKDAMYIYGKESWKEALLEVVDADQLPEHWGGTRVDEIDGNPYCSSQIGIAGSIPTSYYETLTRREYLQNPSLETTIIEAQRCFTLEFNVDTVESTLTWTIGTEEHDIAFGISYNNGDPDSQVEIIPVEKRECQYVPEEGTLICEQVGVYVVTLDNSYSWINGKKVYYEIKVAPPRTAEEDECTRL